MSAVIREDLADILLDIAGDCAPEGPWSRNNAEAFAAALAPRLAMDPAKLHDALFGPPPEGDFYSSEAIPSEGTVKVLALEPTEDMLTALRQHVLIEANDDDLREAVRDLLACIPPASTIPSEPEAKGEAGAGPVGEVVARQHDEGWQPIETAPTGGKFGCFLTLAFGPPGDQTVSEGMHFHGRFYAASVFYTGGPHDTKQFTFREHEVKPTHWRPTPAAPGVSRPAEEPGEVERLRGKLRMIVSHATAGRTDGVGMSTNDISVAITAVRNELWHEARKKPEDALAESEQNAQGLASDLAGTQAELAETRERLEKVRQSPAIDGLSLAAATALVDLFGGEETDMTVQFIKNGHSGSGFYAWCTEYAEDGSEYLGPASEFSYRASLSTQESSAALAGDGKEAGL